MLVPKESPVNLDKLLLNDRKEGLDRKIKILKEDIRHFGPCLQDLSRLEELKKELRELKNV